MKKECLLVVDVQKGFINEYTGHILLPIEKLQYSYKYVIYSKFYTKDDSSNFVKLLNLKDFYKDTDNYQLAIKELTNDERYLSIDKTKYSCVDDFLGWWLLSRQIKEVHICGLETQACITKTALDLFDRDFTPIILSNLCASTESFKKHLEAIQTLKTLIGKKQVIEI